MMGAAAGGDMDSMSINLDLQTQSNILQSDEVELKVVKDLDLEQNADFRPKFNPLGAVLSWISPAGPSDPVRADIENSPRRRAHALGVIKSHLKVKVVAGTRLLDVEYRNSDPKVAANIANHLVQELINYTFQTKYQATNDASAWLEGQLGDLRKQSEDLQLKVVAMQKDTGLFGVGGADLQGKPLVYSPALDSLQQITAQMSQADENRVVKESVYAVVKTGNPELISQLSGTSMGGASSQGVQNSLALIQTLRAQEATLQAQVEQDAAAFGPAYPKLIEERAGLKRVQVLLQNEIGRMAGRAKNDYEIALKTEAGSRQAYDAAKQSAEKVNDKTIAYAILSKEADQSQNLYQDLLKRLKEAGVLAGMKASNIVVVSKAAPPPRPSKPNVQLYLALGLGFGVFLGGVGALLGDAIDNKVRGVEEVEDLGIPLLGILPEVKNLSRKWCMVVDEPASIYSESLRSLRTALLMARSGVPPQIILVTSGSENEGKSTVSLNLAASLAQRDKRVLLIEADLRRPVLRARLNQKGNTGLSNLLADQIASFDAVSMDIYPNVRLVPSGPVPPFPAELLGAERMVKLLSEWREQFDFIVIDSPPILPVSDAYSLSALADATVLVTRVGQTSRVALQRAYGTLLQYAKENVTPTIGVVLNSMPIHSAGYYDYYGYYGNKKSAYYEERGKQ
jgi:capsular exopolysaccharide synthesis family protein